MGVVFTRPALSRMVVATLAALALVGVAVAAPGISQEGPRLGPAATVFGADDDTTTPFNLVDLPALFRHSADGDDFRLQQVLARADSWTKYAVSYRSDGLRVTGALTLPHNPHGAPLIVSLHGFRPPGHYLLGTGLQREERRLADDGFAIFHPDYRNYGGSQATSGKAVARPLGYPSDVINGIVALRRVHLAGIDLTRMGLLGRSMGGGVALQVAEARPTWFKALLLYSPVSSSAALDFARFTEHSPGLQGRVERAFGTPATRPAFWHDASSASYLSRIRVPSIEIHHGLADRVCPESWSVDTAAALRAAGKNVRLYTYAGEPHRFDRRAWPLFIRRAAAYFEQRLG